MLAKIRIMPAARGFLRSTLFLRNTPFRFHVRPASFRVAKFTRGQFFRSVPRCASVACRSGERNLGARTCLWRARIASYEGAPAVVAATKKLLRPLAKQGSSEALCFTPNPRCTPPSPEPPPLAAAKGHPEHPEQPLSTCEGRSGRRTHRPSLLKAFATINGTSLRGLKRNGRFFPTL